MVELKIILCICLIFFFNFKIKGERILFPGEIEAPNGTEHYSCGYTYGLANYYGKFENDSENYQIYYLNRTASKLVSEGFEVTMNTVYGDVLYNFTYSNGSYTRNLAFSGLRAISPVGGKPASYIRAYYMAQLGKQERDASITWLCDGVLINKQWIITAAHCFLKTHQAPNLVRLGDYDLNEPEEQGINNYGKFINDYPIDDVILHPEFQLNQRYHDLALVKIPTPYPAYSGFIRPICLAWGSHTNRNLIGKELVLTGWGAVKYGGPKVPLLQEVSLKVFKTSVCNESYFELPNNDVEYPNGMSDEDILCVGWDKDGKDACGGDSGAPVVYQENGDGRFILAGIVSKGYGCGLKDHPGIYMPLNKPKYLRWIKEIAF